MEEKVSQPISAAPADPAKFHTYPVPSTSDSLPLLVKMPNGERHQVDVAPTASVKDLKTSIANHSSTLGFPFGDQDQSWDLGFGGATLSDNQSLSHYNIPDVYDHANGLLKTISDSGYGDPDKKLEALGKACAVVAGISRGERDMERLINAVFDEVNDSTPGSPTPQQPSLATLKRSRRSRIPPLNLDSLPPPENPLGPPTPSQLIRKLSGVRPDLYDPSAAERATGTSGQPGSTLSRPGLRSLGGNDSAQLSGSGELKRGITWFTDVMSCLGNSVPKPSKPGYDGDGNSEGEHENSDPDGDSEDGDEPSPTKDSTVPEPLKAEELNESAGKEEAVLRRADSQQNTATGSLLEETKKTNKPEQGNEVDNEAKGVANGKGCTAASSSAPIEETTNKTSVPSSSAARQVIGLGPDAGPTEDVKLPKKRGRKRKNPHLTEEQRRAQRQAQNRASAKQSRMRRKHMTKEYERRVHTLEGENENLRDTVAALTDRLEILQNLLTVSVQKRPMPHINAAAQDGMAGPAQLGTQTLNVQPPLTGQGALSAPGALNAHFTPSSQYHAAPQTHSQGLAGAPGIPHSTPPQSNHLGNLGFKNM